MLGKHVLGISRHLLRHVRLELKVREVRGNELELQGLVDDESAPLAEISLLVRPIALVVSLLGPLGREGDALPGRLAQEFRHASNGSGGAVGGIRDRRGRRRRCRS